MSTPLTFYIASYCTSDLAIHLATSFPAGSPPALPCVSKLLRLPENTTKNSLVGLAFTEFAVLQDVLMLERRADDEETSSDEEEAYQRCIPAPMFAPIPPPKIRLISHEALVKWDWPRREYEAKMRARCRIIDVTEGQIIAEIQALLAKVKNDDVPDIKLLFKQELKMDMKETDADARILSYLQRFKQVVKENGLEDVFSGEDGEREKCKRLISCLAPPVLKADVKTAVRWTNKEAAKNI
ncbi:unnamed protein product [Phytophthora fragariaefolia]|uniref:Unnamed protein product n=1 Tax=Phytophthora fragariaefolia TaxID=1490495 RepID=A0A9W6Y1T9_9STRA|nr:unnamed protein product [Phytophthora fragariaefolia]